MKKYFYELSTELKKQTAADEVSIGMFSGEQTDFTRISKNKVRQAGHVTQMSLGLELVKGNRHAKSAVCLAGDLGFDRPRIDSLLKRLRAQIAVLPDDPHLLYSTEVASGETVRENRLSESGATVATVMQSAGSLDLVGLFAAGGIFRGFCNSFGQRNWYETYSFNMDFSLYHAGDKAVKSQYAGFRWDQAEFSRVFGRASAQLAALTRPAKTIQPGKYRVYLAPAAVDEIMGTLAWGAFGLKAHKTKQTPLLKMIEEGKRLHQDVTLVENTAEGISPNFDSAGFLKPDKVTLVEKGQLRDQLVSARSAKEYGVKPGGASPGEAPQSLEMLAGKIPAAEALKTLDTGIYINNLHYLNYSDHAAGRLTGMTRFATFWVEKGEIVAPLNVMRFDESVFRMLGENLIGLTKEREFAFDSGTYEERATSSRHLPGALVNDFTLTL